MPQGVEVLVEDGFATIDFVDPSTRGPGLAKLLEVGGPETIEPDTRSGPRKVYRVPEGNAREAGLLDKASTVDELSKPDTSSAGNAEGAVQPEAPTSRNAHSQTVRTGTYSAAYAAEHLGNGALPGPPDAAVEKTWPDGEPSEDWRRDELDDYALAVRKLDTTGLPNKTAVLAAINPSKETS